jgi:hypothetical protein
MSKIKLQHHGILLATQHHGILLATQKDWALSQLMLALDQVLTESRAENWKGQLRWLSQWR